MEVSADGKSMEGFHTGHPDDWRKAAWKRALGAEEVEEFEAAVASASSTHVHQGCCGHH